LLEKESPNHLEGVYSYQSLDGPIILYLESPLVRLFVVDLALMLQEGGRRLWLRGLHRN
jgi:hypothetical protein